MGEGLDLLDRLVLEARQDLQRRRYLMDSDRFEQAVAAYTPKDFAAALRRPQLAVIAEMKQRTPSVGVLANDYEPANLAAGYQQGGAAAISVLTHAAGFGGSIDHLDEVRGASDLPILRKDFITDPYQVVEARAHGADAVLLIVAALPAGKLTELLNVATRHQLAALVEVHDEGESRAAVEAGAKLIGVNHRDLRTFDVDLTLTERLRPLIPRECVLVAESGIKNRQDARRMREAGADAILVGELLMRAANPAEAITDLRAG